jgi:hypothetical protein
MHVDANRGLNETIIPNRIAEYWEQIVKGDPTLALSLYQTEQNVFAGLYFAYESFLRDCYESSPGATVEWERERSKTKLLRLIYDEQTVELIWTARDVNHARLIRSSIAHCCGRVTEDIKRQRPPVNIAVNGDRLIIGAKETTSLHNLLKGRALIAARATAAKLRSSSLPASPPSPPEIAGASSA